jgi:SAM-dependent methyltransferase
MDQITNLLKDYHEDTFARFGPTARGVDWNDEGELLVRYDKMLAVRDMDFYAGPPVPSLLDVGCGWGGLASRAQERGLELAITGVDVVESMVAHGRSHFPRCRFLCEDVFALSTEDKYDFVVCNAIMTQKHGISIPEMESFSKRLIKHMFALCRFGIAFNMMSTKVNYTVSNLYYQNPVELFAWLLAELSPRVVLDHGYSSLASGTGKYYDFTAYVYKG